MAKKTSRKKSATRRKAARKTAKGYPTQPKLKQLTMKDVQSHIKTHVQILNEAGQTEQARRAAKKLERWLKEFPAICGLDMVVPLI